MHITCTNCSHAFDFPEEKLPPSPRFSIKCPNCRDKIIIDRQEEPKREESAPETGNLKTIEPDIFPPGALVVFSFIQSGSWNGAVESFFSAKGYYLSKAMEVDEAIQKLRLNEYNVIVIDDRHSNQVLLKEIGAWTGLKRRWVNVILIGDRATSLNPQESFVRGVNAYLNINDVNRARELFEEALKGFELQNEPWQLAAETEE